MHNLILVPGQHGCRPEKCAKPWGAKPALTGAATTQKQHGTPAGYQTGAHSVDGDELNKNGAAGSAEASGKCRRRTREAVFYLSPGALARVPAQVPMQVSLLQPDSAPAPVGATIRVLNP
jgi:hypothetical protein